MFAEHRSGCTSCSRWRRHILFPGCITGPDSDSRFLYGILYRYRVPVKRHRGEPGNSREIHGTRGHTKAHGPRRRTSQPSKPTNNTHPARQRDDRSRGRLNSHRPRADRSPRQAQKRPSPANPTLPPPAPRAPPRACSKAVGEMKARAADA